MSKGNPLTSHNNNPELFPCGKPENKNHLGNIRNQILSDEIIDALCKRIAEKLENDECQDLVSGIKKSWDNF